MNLVSNKLKLIKPSATLEINRKASELKASGINIISLSAGEPDFDTPDHIKQAAKKAIEDGFTKYTNVDGIAPLKKAIQNKLIRENNLKYDLDQIIVSTGGKQVIYNALMSSINEGDEVIIPSPYWVSYAEIVTLASGVPVFIECDIKHGFKLQPSALQKVITSKTKWLILNSPSNPTGATYSKNELSNLAQVLIQHPQVLIMSDDIYEHILFDNATFCNIAQVSSELKERTLIVNGVSKAYAMTGWRIGYGAGPKELIGAMTILQSQSTSNASSISQMAAIEALNGDQSFIKTKTTEFEAKRNLALSILKDTKGLELTIPQGAFYLFIKCDQLFGYKTKYGYIIQNSNDLCRYLLEDASVAVVPGLAFGNDSYFRLSFATSHALLQEACLKMKKSLNELYQIPD